MFQMQARITIQIPTMSAPSLLGQLFGRCVDSLYLGFRLYMLQPHLPGACVNYVYWVLVYIYIYYYLYYIFRYNIDVHCLGGHDAF